MSKPEKKTRVDAFIDFCKNNKLISIIIVLGIMVIALSQFTEAVDKIRGFFRSEEHVVKGPSFTLLTSIWKVELDTKGALVASKEFPSTSADGLKDAAEWVSDQLGLTTQKSAPKIHLKVQIPGDLKNQKPIIQRIPDGPMEVLLWDERGNAKGRSRLTWEVLKDMQTPFQLEIQIPGRETAVIEAMPGTALVKEMDMAPAIVSIGVEKFTGQDDGISARVCSQLGANPLIKVVSPDILEAVRKEIENQKENMRAHPMVQAGIRAMGVDYIISGSVQTKTP
jgi:hypothetical protein